jgi:predicted O-methyltransferase YrrM
MSATLFEDVDRYINQLFAPPDPALDAALEAAAQAGMPQIQVSANLGKLLYLLAKLAGARRILELGTLAGYSTIWMARALPDGGRLTSLEYNPNHAGVARDNIARAGLLEKVEIMVGPALQTLPELHKRGSEPFDMVFIDADKNNYPAYLDWALRLTRPGGLILGDNVVREGRILDEDSPDQALQGARTFNSALAADPRVEATIIQQVGEKGHDGIAVALVKGP